MALGLLFSWSLLPRNQSPFPYHLGFSRLYTIELALGHAVAPPRKVPRRPSPSISRGKIPKPVQTVYRTHVHSRRSGCRGGSKMLLSRPIATALTGGTERCLDTISLSISRRPRCLNLQREPIGLAIFLTESQGRSRVYYCGRGETSLNRIKILIILGRHSVSSGMYWLHGLPR